MSYASRYAAGMDEIVAALVKNIAKREGVTPAALLKGLLDNRQKPSDSLTYETKEDQRREVCGAYSQDTVASGRSHCEDSSGSR